MGAKDPGDWKDAKEGANDAAEFSNPISETTDIAR